MHQDEGLQVDSEPDSPEVVEFRIRDDFDATTPPLPLLCEDESDNGKVRLYH